MLTAPGRNETLQGNLDRQRTEHHQYQLRAKDCDQSMVWFHRNTRQERTTHCGLRRSQSGLEMGSLRPLGCSGHRGVPLLLLSPNLRVSDYFARAPGNEIYVFCGAQRQSGGGGLRGGRAPQADPDHPPHPRRATTGWSTPTIL